MFTCTEVLWNCLSLKCLKNLNILLSSSSVFNGTYSENTVGFNKTAVFIDQFNLAIVLIDAPEIVKTLKQTQPKY